MKEKNCPRCRAKLSPDSSVCPKCGFSYKPDKERIFTIAGICLICVAFAGGILFNMKSEARIPEPTPTIEVIEFFETPAPPPTPTPTPSVESIEVYAFGRKLDADGFTAYVGDKPFTLSAYPQPNLPRPEVTWSVGDSASLSVSGDTLTCEFTALKPSGKNELIVRCYGAEVVIPVYLWEK